MNRIFERIKEAKARVPIIAPYHFDPIRKTKAVRVDGVYILVNIDEWDAHFLSDNIQVYGRWGSI